MVELLITLLAVDTAAVAGCLVERDGDSGLLSLS
jgi:hypothetical protein